MEIETLILNGDGETKETIGKRKHENKFQWNILHASIDHREIILKAIFSTDFIPDDDKKSFQIENLDEITNELNEMLNKTKIVIIQGIFHNYFTLKKSLELKCLNHLYGKILQLNILISSSSSDQWNINELKNEFHRMLIFPLIIQFSNKQHQIIPMKICSITEISEDNSISIRLKKDSFQSTIRTRRKKFSLDKILKRSVCLMNPGKISLVLMAGEKGTEIRDYKNNQINLLNQNHLSVTIYEHTVYLIRIELDCSWQLNSDLFEKGCNLAQDVNVYIDINNDGIFQSNESGTPFHWPITSYMAQGIYDLQLYIPFIDNKHLTNGKHRMMINVMPTDNYQEICQDKQYNESRFYDINIISRTTEISPTIDTTPSIILNNIDCSIDLGKIIVVIMGGEYQTQIFDDVSRNDLIKKNSLNNDNRQSIIFYENTVYQVRIQLNCSQEWNNDLSKDNCELNYDINVWIDLNNDNIYQNEENAAPYRWPLHSYTPRGIYDLQISIPIIHTTTKKFGPYKMQILTTLNDQYRYQCTNHDYKDIREYTVYIIPINTKNLDDIEIPHLMLNNDENLCSMKNGEIVLVTMSGEQGSHIRDNILKDILSEKQNRHHLNVYLYENMNYQIRIQLDCLNKENCNFVQDVNILIDFNNDNIFEQSESRIPHRSPLRSSIPFGIYDLNIYIPSVDEINIKSGQHRMKVIVKSSDEYINKCGNNDYYHTREYMINIISKTDSTILNDPIPIVSPNYPTTVEIFFSKQGSTDSEQFNTTESIPKIQQGKGCKCWWILIFDFLIVLILLILLICCLLYKCNMFKRCKRNRPTEPTPPKKPTPPIPDPPIKPTRPIVQPPPRPDSPIEPIVRTPPEPDLPTEPKHSPPPLPIDLSPIVIGQLEWFPVGPMTNARRSHRALLLSNGKVLITGGFNYGSLNNPELYDSSTNTWITIERINDTRSTNTSRTSEHETELVTGQLGSHYFIDSVELYDPSNESWTNLPNMNIARGGHTTSLLLNEQILVAGGYTNGKYLNNTELFNPSTLTWTNTCPMNDARAEHTVSILKNGKVLVAAGFEYYHWLNSAEIYDPKTQIWTRTGYMNYSRSKHTSSLLRNGQILITGGYSCGHWLNTAELYDPLTETWKITNDMNIARGEHTESVLTNGKVLIAGGYNRGALNDVELYDPETETWTVITNMNYPRFSHTASLLNNGYLLIIGGVNNNALNTVELYDPSRGTWTIIENLKDARGEHTATVLTDSKVLITGGSDRGRTLKSTELLK
ncbi:unnamed protein product [Adineta steineri]|uniref:GEVED domain-containing protein n=1 Tax=Adineta steineri TaxID=433720 RepID=A0A819Q1E2_9BILA|nr:unnamed protein product [Adineta steineri]